MNEREKELLLGQKQKKFQDIDLTNYKNIEDFKKIITELYNKKGGPFLVRTIHVPFSWGYLRSVFNKVSKPDSKRIRILKGFSKTLLGSSHLKEKFRRSNDASVFLFASEGLFMTLGETFYLPVEDRPKDFLFGYEEEDKKVLALLKKRSEIFREK